MTIKLAKTGNYFIVSKADDDSVIFERPSKDIYFKNSNGTIMFFEKENNQELGGFQGFPLNATQAVGSVQLTSGASGSVDMITVDSVNIMSGAEAFDTDLETTAQNVADNINAHVSDPNYTAEADGDTINIISVDKGTGSNELVVASTVTTITKTDSNMAGATTDIQNSSGTPYADIDALLTFLRANTGA